MGFNIGKALSGAGTGAIYGGMFGGPLGAAAGGATGSLFGLGSKKSSKPKRISTFDPRQRQLYEQYLQALQGGGGPLADVFAQFDPEQIRQLYEKSYAQPAYQKFQEEIVPTITGQFRGQNLQNSSYLGGALAKAGTNVQRGLDSNLANLLYQSQQDSVSRRGNAANSLLGMNTFDYQKRQPGVFDDLLSSLASGAGQLLTRKFGG